MACKCRTIISLLFIFLVFSKEIAKKSNGQNNHCTVLNYYLKMFFFVNTMKELHQTLQAKNCQLTSTKEAPTTCCKNIFTISMATSLSVEADLKECSFFRSDLTSFLPKKLLLSCEPTNMLHAGSRL